MSGVDPFVLFWLFLKASLFSTGGTGNLPLLYQDLLIRGWATDQMFAEALAIGQLTPGPTGLWVISLGYLVYGVVGSVLAAVAITLPPLLILLVSVAHQRVGGHAFVRGLIRGLSLAVIGVFLIVLSRLMPGPIPDLRAVAIALIVFVLALTQRIPVVVLLGMAAIAGIILYR